MTIQHLKAGDKVTDFFLLRLAEIKVSSNHKKYLDFTLADKTGEINGKYWDVTPEDEENFQSHRLVKIQGTVTEWQQRLQLKIAKVRLTQPDDGVNMRDFLPCAPEDPQAMLKEIESVIEGMNHPDLKKIVAALVAEKEEKLLYYPAAKENHHAVISGLLYHINTMLRAAKGLVQVYPALNQDLLFAGIILHDLAKTDEMQAGPMGLITEYTAEGQLLGHIVQGIRDIDRTARALGADGEMAMLLQHMVLSHHYEPEFGSPRRPMIPEGELLHYLDMIDARMYDMNRVLQNTKEGTFSDRVYVLHNRKLYRSSPEEEKGQTEDF